jgi:membrane protein YqaA with SNARE-associated domain
MAIFHTLYEKILHWSKHRHASYYLGAVSFFESSVFPIPPDVMLIPMVLSKPDKAWKYAMIMTLASIVGGIFGYALGYFAFEIIGQTIIETFNYQALYAKVSSWFDHYGTFAVLLAGVTPIPYKLFTIGAGVSRMAFLPFIIASIIGRSLRFFAVAALVRHLGIRYESLLRKYIDRLSWALIMMVALGLAIFVFFFQR